MDSEPVASSSIAEEYDPRKEGIEVFKHSYDWQDPPPDPYAEASYPYEQYQWRDTNIPDSDEEDSYDPSDDDSSFDTESDDFDFNPDPIRQEGDESSSDLSEDRSWRSRGKRHAERFRSKVKSIINFAAELLMMAFIFIKGPEAIELFKRVFRAPIRRDNTTYRGSPHPPHQAGYHSFDVNQVEYMMGGNRIKKLLQKIIKLFERDASSRESGENKIDNALENNPKKFTRKLMNAMGYASTGLRKYHVHFVQLWWRWCFRSKKESGKEKCEIMYQAIMKDNITVKDIEDYIETKYGSTPLQDRIIWDEEKKKGENQSGGSDMLWYNRYMNMKKLYKQLKHNQNKMVGGAMSSKEMYNHGIHGRNASLYWFNEYRKMKKLYKQLKRRY